VQQAITHRPELHTSSLPSCLASYLLAAQDHVAHVNNKQGPPADLYRALGVVISHVVHRSRCWQSLDLLLWVPGGTHLYG
jgi:hypothetical protein